jgi:hypothetical protein
VTARDAALSAVFKTGFAEKEVTLDDRSNLAGACR